MQAHIAKRYIIVVEEGGMFEEIYMHKAAHWEILGYMGMVNGKYLARIKSYPFPCAIEIPCMSTENEYALYDFHIAYSKFVEGKPNPFPVRYVSRVDVDLCIQKQKEKANAIQASSSSNQSS